MGYTPHAGARRLAMQKMETIGLIFTDDIKALANLHISELTHAVAVEARRHGYDLLLNYFNLAHPDDFPTSPGRVDGSIVVTSRDVPGDFLQRFETSRHPHVVIGGGYLRPKPANFVDVDVSTGMLNATRHLIQNGHRDIAFLSGPGSDDKLNGYIVALTKHRLPIRRDCILSCDLTDGGIAAAVDELLGLAVPPTAIVAGSDWLAIRAIRFLQERGCRVPDDLSVTGFDNVEISAMITPPLTTIRVPGARIAELAVDQVVKLIDGKANRSMQVLLPAELVYRGSTAPRIEPAEAEPSLAPGSEADLTRTPE